LSQIATLVIPAASAIPLPKQGCDPNPIPIRKVNKRYTRGCSSRERKGILQGRFMMIELS
jgi:hypothetical protein